jgi:hypothetical protein
MKSHASTISCVQWDHQHYGLGPTSKYPPQQTGLELMYRNFIQFFPAGFSKASKSVGGDNVDNILSNHICKNSLDWHQGLTGKLQKEITYIHVFCSLIL